MLVFVVGISAGVVIRRAMLEHVTDNASDISPAFWDNSAPDTQQTVRRLSGCAVACVLARGRASLVRSW